MTANVFQIIVIMVVLIIAWLVIERWSPDPLITKIAQILLFLIALWVVVSRILPMAGISF